MILGKGLHAETLAFALIERLEEVFEVPRCRRHGDCRARSQAVGSKDKFESGVCTGQVRPSLGLGEVWR